jgi:phage antirepressor YoqD-like protein
MYLFKSESNMNASTFTIKTINWLHEQGHVNITIITLIAYRH